MIFHWKGQTNTVLAGLEGPVLEVRVAHSSGVKTSHFPLDPIKGFQEGEPIRTHGVKHAASTAHHDFTDGRAIRYTVADPRFGVGKHPAWKHPEPKK